MWRRCGWVVGLLAMVLASPAVAVDMNRNGSGIPSWAKSAGAYTAGHVLTVDSGGNTATFAAAASGSGDITDVWGCTTGNCNALTAAAGDSLDAGSADSSRPATRSTSLPGTCSEGQLHQDTDSAGTETYICTATNTWTKALGGTDLDTSADLAGLLGDETGSGAVVFGTSPTLGAPVIADFTSAGHDHQDADDGGTLSITAATTGTLTLARGGTNATSFTANRCVRVNSAGTALEAHGSDCGSAVAAPETAEYVTMSTNGTLTAERVLTAGTALDLTDAGAGSTVTFDWDSTEVGTTTYGSGSGITWTFNASAGTDPAIAFGNGTVNVSTGTLQQGGTAVVLASRSITTTSPLSGGGDLSADRTLAITANGIGPTQIDETANYTWSGSNAYTSTNSFAAGGLILAQNTAANCATVTLEGGACWSTDTDALQIGTASSTKTLVDTGRTISTTSPLTGGGDLSANRTLSITANGIGPTQIDETAAYTWTGAHAFQNATTTFLGDLLVANQKDLRLFEAIGNGTDYFALQAPAAITTSATFTWAATGQCTGTNGGALTIDASNNIICTDDDSGSGITGSGADDYLVRWDGTAAVEAATVHNDATTGRLSNDLATTATSGTTLRALAGSIVNAAAAGSQSGAVVRGAYDDSLVGGNQTGTWIGVLGTTAHTDDTYAEATLRGVYGQARSTSDAATTTLLGVYGEASRESGSGTVTNAYGGYFGVNNDAGTITNGYGVYIADSDATGTITNDFGLYQAGGERNHFGGPVGIGTTTVPHGGVGYATVALDGPNASSAGPHLQVTTASDNYPLFQQLNYQHDNIALCFDCYYDGAFRAADTGTGTAYMLYKGGGGTPDKLNLQVASGTTQGNAASFVSAMLTGAADVVFNEDSADRDFRVETDANANALVIDGGANAVTLGSATSIDAALVFNEAGAAVSARFETDNASSALVVDGANDKVTFGVPEDGSWTTTSTSNVTAVARALTANPAGGTAAYTGADFSVTTGASAAAVTSVAGVLGTATCATSNGCSAGVGTYGEVVKSGTGALGAAYGVFAHVSNQNASGAITTGYGVYIADSTTTGAITNDWALYAAGAEDSYLGGPLRLAAGSSDAAAPAAGQAKRSAFAPSNWTFPMPSVRTPNERMWRELPGLMSSWATSCILPGTGTAPVSVGIPHNAVGGTVSHPTAATTNLLTASMRTLFASGAGAGSSTGTYAGKRMVWRGNAAGLGGFLFYARFATTTAVAQQRAFVGIQDAAAAIANVEPNTLVDSIYVGYNAAATTLSVCGNNNAGNAGCTSLGANFPVNSSAVYDVWFYAPPNGSRWDYYVERLDSAQTASGTEADATDMPQATVFLQPQVWVNNGTTASSAEINLMRMCVSSPL